MAEQRGMPSMLALLGLLAVAGYQNRDKISDFLQKQGIGTGAGAGAGTPNGDGATPAGGGLLSELGGLLGGVLGGGAASAGAASAGASSSNGSITGGLNDLIDTFKNSGHAEVADSWVNPAVPTQGLSPSQVESAIGKDALDELASRTGLTYDEIVQRLSTTIPQAVDKLTPGGHMPQSDDDVAKILRSV